MAERSTSSRERYLRYDDRERTSVGIGHWLTNLKCIALEAAALGRLATVPTLVLTEVHNFGVQLDWKWETYFDLGAGRLVNIVTGRSRPIPLATREPPPHATIVTLNPRERVPRRARSVDLIVRRVDGYYPRSVPPGLMPNWTRLAVPPSAAVANLSQSVVERLRALPGGYAAVHIRRGDRARIPAYAPWAEATTLERVRSKLREHGIGRDTPVYFMSDERDPEYWAALRDCCRIYRHPDFPELSAIVSRDRTGGPDNYLLFVTEQEVMRHARLRIGTAWGPERPPADDWLVKPPKPGPRRAVHWLRRRLVFGPQARGSAWAGRVPR